MLKLTILLIALSTFSLVSYSQRMCENAKIEFSDLNLEKGKKVTIVSAFKTDEGYVVLKKEPIRGPGGWHYFLENFDHDLNSVSLHDISEQFENDDYVIGQVMKVKNSYVLFSTKQIPESRKEDLYVQKFNWQDNELSKPERIYSQPYEGRKRGINYNLGSSQDENFLLITIHPPSTGREKEKMIFKVMDENIEEIWSEENVELDEEDRTYSILQTTLGNNGAIYILGRKFRPRDRKAGVKRGPDEYEIVAITDEGQETTPLKLDNKLIDNISLFASENGEIFVGGYYRVEDGVGIDGIFLYTLNKKTGEIENEISDAFSKEFITEGWSERRVNKAKKKEDKGTDLGLRNLEFRRIVSHDDGSTSMVGEVFYITTHTYTNGSGGTTTTTTYHYTDLIISRISKEGEVMNHARYPKHHTYYGAYIYFNLNNELAIILNKSRIPLLDGDEKEMSKIEKKKNGGDALTLIQISENGETRSSGIIDYKNPEYIRFERYKRIAPDSFVIEENGKTEVLLKTYYGKGRFGIGRIIFE